MEGDDGLMDFEGHNTEICRFVVFHKSTKEENTKENSKIKINARVCSLNQRLFLLLSVAELTL